MRQREESFKYFFFAFYLSFTKQATAGILNALLLQRNTTHIFKNMAKDVRVLSTQLKTNHQDKYKNKKTITKLHNRKKAFMKYSLLLGN